jgi:sugar phosphate isomerase/epimerase
MNEIRLTGETVTCSNYATRRLFHCGTEAVRSAAEAFLTCGIPEIEIPQGVLDPDNRFPDKGVDKEALGSTIAALPHETRVIGTYLSARTLGSDNDEYLEQQKRALEHLTQYFPYLTYAMLHPARQAFAQRDAIMHIIDVWVALADHAVSLRDGFQLCWHNHYDTSGETGDQVRLYLDGIAAADHPGLKWGPDTGHCHGMRDEFLDVLDAYAHLIGDFCHVKARVPAFDRLHGGEEYDQERDIWSNPAAIGVGLYGGFVNVADPEAVTPLGDFFQIIRDKANPASGKVRCALEIDIPRQHPLLEVLCAVLYLKNVHGIEGGLALSNGEIIRGAFGR